MAFQTLRCTNCGANIQVDDSRAIGFCSYCGAQILLKDIVEVRHVGLNPAEYRDAALEELYSIKNYLEDRNEKALALQRALKIERTTKLKSTKDYYLIGGIIIGLLLACSAGAFRINDVVRGAETLAALLGLAFLFWLFIIKPAPKKGQANMAKMQEIHENVVEAEKAYNSISFDFDSATVSTEYFELSKIVALINYIESGRADTIKEAINAYVDDGYKEEMKQIAQNTQRAMEASARAAESAARAANYNARVNTLNFLFKK